LVNRSLPLTGSRYGRSIGSHGAYASYSPSEFPGNTVTSRRAIIQTLSRRRFERRPVVDIRRPFKQIDSDAIAFAVGCRRYDTQRGPSIFAKASDGRVSKREVWPVTVSIRSPATKRNERAVIRPDDSFVVKSAAYRPTCLLFIASGSRTPLGSRRDVPSFFRRPSSATFFTKTLTRERGPAVRFVQNELVAATNGRSRRFVYYYVRESSRAIKTRGLFTFTKIRRCILTAISRRAPDGPTNKSNFVEKRVSFERARLYTNGNFKRTFRPTFDTSSR